MNIPANMKLPMQINFHNMAHSAALESSIYAKAAMLERFSDLVRRFRVTVEAPNRRADNGVMYHVTVDISVQDSDIIVSHNPQLRHANEDAYVAIHDAMDSAGQQLEEYALKRHGREKTRRKASILPGHLLD